MSRRVQCVLQSILCTRLLLHLHVLTSALHDTPEPTEFSTVLLTETIGSVRRSSYQPSLDTPPDSPWSSVPLTRYRGRTTEAHGN